MGGGHKRKLRLIDFKRNYDGVPAVVKSIEYDPNRSARIALLYYTDGSKAYIIAPNGLQVGQTVMSGEDVAPGGGKHTSLAKIPVGTPDPLYRAPSRTGRLHGSLAGTFAQLTSREGDYAIIKLPSGETRKVLLTCRATIGVVGNSDHAPRIERQGWTQPLARPPSLTTAVSS